MKPIHANTKTRRHWKAPVLSLAPDGLVGTAGVIAKTRHPVHVDKALLDFVNLHAGSIERTNRGARAGAHHDIDGYLQFFQHTQHTNMGHTLGATTAEHQPYLWPPCISQRRHTRQHCKQQHQ